LEHVSEIHAQEFFMHLIEKVLKSDTKKEAEAI